MHSVFYLQKSVIILLKTLHNNMLRVPLYRKLLVKIFILMFHLLGLRSVPHCGLYRTTRSHTASGSAFSAPPCSPAHLAGPVHHGLSDAGRDVNNKSWSRNHRGSHKSEGGREGGCRPQRLCGRFAPLILSRWQFDGCTRGDVGLYVCVYSVYIYGVYTAHQLVFFFTLKGDFPVASCFGKSN